MEFGEGFHRPLTILKVVTILKLALITTVDLSRAIYRFTIFLPEYMDGTLWHRAHVCSIATASTCMEY